MAVGGLKHFGTSAGDGCILSLRDATARRASGKPPGPRSRLNLFPA